MTVKLRRHSTTLQWEKTGNSITNTLESLTLTFKINSLDILDHYVSDIDQGSLLLPWINLNRSMDK